MKTHYAMPDNAALLKYIPDTSIATMKYTSFNASYRIKERLCKSCRKVQLATQ